MADRLEHLSDLAVPPFANRDADRCVRDRFADVFHGARGPTPARWKTSRSSGDSRARVWWADYLHLRRFCFVPIDDNSASQSREVMFIRGSEDARFVDACDAVPRMRQPRGEVAVVGQQQQPF